MTIKLNYAIARNDSSEVHNIFMSQTNKRDISDVAPDKKGVMMT